MAENTIIEENITEENDVVEEKNELTDKDFYDQACQYFYYHAEQRMNMINYFIAVFGAGIALFGNVIEKSPVVAGFIALFLLIISALFRSIDFRNKFDVKQSQSVIAQIEKDYKRDQLKEEANATYGVFSNEDNTFRYYGLEHRKEDQNAKYREFLQRHKDIEKLKKKRADEKQIKTLQDELDKDIDKYLEKDKTISKKELKHSLEERSILSLSNSIKWMYNMCIIASTGGLAWALYRVIF